MPSRAFSLVIVVFCSSPVAVAGLLFQKGSATQQDDQNGLIHTHDETTAGSVNGFLAMVGQPVPSIPASQNFDESLDDMFSRGPAAPSAPSAPPASQPESPSLETKDTSVHEHHKLKKKHAPTPPSLDELMSHKDHESTKVSKQEHSKVSEQMSSKMSEHEPSKATNQEDSKALDNEHSKAADEDHSKNHGDAKSKGSSLPLSERADSWKEHHEAEDHISYEQHVRLRIAKPITWFHVPKCGTSFANTLFHHKEICPKFPEKAMISRVKTGIPGPMLKMITSNPGMYGVDIGKFTANNSLEEYCGHSIDTRLQGLGHNGVGMAWNEVAGHSMIFLRQPEQRLISAYRHGRHGCTTCYKSTTLGEYAPLAAGCVTRMLNREGDDVCVNKSPPTLVEMAQALHRLRTGFIFIGITEQWDLSVCLFHAKFGGKCNAYETLNTRPGRYLDDTHPTYYDTEELNGFVDIFDRQLYMEAVAIFERDVERFGLTHESCQKLCQ